MNTKKLGLFAVTAMAASFSTHAQTVQWDFTSGLLTGTSQTGSAPGTPCFSAPSNCGVTPTLGIITGEVDATNGAVTSFNFNFDGVNYGTNLFSYGNIGDGVSGPVRTNENTGIPNLSLYTGALTGYIDLSSGAPIINLAQSANNAGVTFDLVINSTSTQFGLSYFDVAPGINCDYSDPLISTTGGSVRNPCAMQVSSTTPGSWKAPELDSSSAASGLTLLLGGLTVLRGRRKVVGNDSH
jgi:hypothetical protein